MRWKVNRNKVKGRKICYWLKPANVLIIDPGNKDGEIHIYEHLITANSSNLKNIIEEFIGDSDIASTSYLEVMELKEDVTLFGEIFTYQK